MEHLLSMDPAHEMECVQGGTAKDQDGQQRLGICSLWMENMARLSASAMVHGQDCQQVSCWPSYGD